MTSHMTADQTGLPTNRIEITSKPKDPALGTSSPVFSPVSTQGALGRRQL
jgi:hypothetical protein